MEAILNVDERFMDSLRNKLNTNDDKVVIQTALAALDWMADERRSGKVILSSTSKGQDLKRLSLPLLEKLGNR